MPFASMPNRTLASAGTSLLVCGQGCSVAEVWARAAGSGEAARARPAASAAKEGLEIMKPQV